MASRLLIIRHACVAPAFEERFVGKTNVSLNGRGERQAKAIADLASTWNLSKCYVSPMARALQTAGPIIEKLNISAQCEDDLREIDFGKWEGMTFCQVQREHGHLVDQWCASCGDFAFPSGESMTDFHLRIERCAAKLSTDPADTVLAVTHGGIIRALICRLLGLRPCDHVLFDVRPGSVTTIDFNDGKGLLVGLNDTCHLEGVDIDPHR